MQIILGGFNNEKICFNALGEWYLSGYTYTQEQINSVSKDGTTVNGAKTTPLHILDTKVIPSGLFANGILKYDFKGEEITSAHSGTADAYLMTEVYFEAIDKATTLKNIRKKVFSDAYFKTNNALIHFFPMVDTATESQNSLSQNGYDWGSSVPYNKLNGGTSYAFSFYAYTQNSDNDSLPGGHIKFDIRNFKGTSNTHDNIGNFYIKASDLVSEKGIPHKVDIVLVGAGNDVVYPHVYVDGIDKTHSYGPDDTKLNGINNNSSTAITMTHGTGSYLTFRTNTEIDLKYNTVLSSNIINGNKSSTITMSNADWYIQNYTGVTQFNIKNLDDLTAELIQVPGYTSTANATEFRKDDYITGVKGLLKESLKTALETTSAGDRVVSIPSTYYNKPANLFTGDSTSVKLISKTNGAEVTPASATGTMDDYYLQVNGIYVVAESYEVPVGEIVLHGLSYNAKTKTAELSYTDNNAPDDISSENNKGAVKNYKETVYSFDYGNVHFVTLNSGYHSTTNYIKAIIRQRSEWLKADLASSNAKWKIVMIHQGLYGARSTTSNTRELLEPIMDEYGVDLVLQGHDHFVMRTYPMESGEIITKENPNNITKRSGVIYNILGASGAKRYEDSTKPDYSVVHINSGASLPTYTTFKVSDNKIEVVIKQINGVVVDSFTITDQ